MKSLKKNIFLVVLLGTGALLTKGKAVPPVKGDAAAEAARQQFLDEIADKRAQIAKLENAPFDKSLTQSERLAEAEKRDAQVVALEKEISEIKETKHKHFVSVLAPSRITTMMEGEAKQEKKSAEKASQVKSEVQEKINQKHKEITQLKEEKAESGKDDSTANHDPKIKALKAEVKELHEDKEEASKDDAESQSDFEKTIERIINSRTTTLNDLKENSKQPFTQIIAQEIDMREKELESLNKILANTDTKSSELGSWISTETSTKTEDREELENELDIIKRMIKRRMIVVKKLEDKNPRPFTQKIAEDVDFRREEIKLLRSRKKELMEALGVDNDTPSVKKEARRKLGRLSKKKGKKNKEKGKKNKEKKRARKNRKKGE